MSARWDAWTKEIDCGDKLPRKMPLSAFLRMLPNWALAEIADESNPAVCMHAVLLHESLWQDGEAITYSHAWLTTMKVAVALENQRRLGICKYTVEGDDRLFNGGALTIELNPAIMGLVGSEEAAAWIVDDAPNLSDRDTAFKKKLLGLAIASDWCDRVALEAP